MKADIQVHDFFTQSVTQKHPLGTTAEWLGKIFIYSKANEGLSANQILTPIATPTYAVDAVATNTATEDSVFGKMAISQVINITDAGATVAAGALAGMLVFVDDGLGEGQAQWIIGNTAGASGSSMKIYLAAALGTALTGAGVSDITVYSEHVVEMAAITSKKQVVVGSPPIDVTSGYYFWRLRYGMGLCKHGATTAAGCKLIPGDDTEGQAVTAAADEDVGDVSSFATAITDCPVADSGCVAFFNCP